jgi:SAM-dependent methyltransferase
MEPHDHGRHGARQPTRFDPARAALLDDPARFAYLAPEALAALLDAPRNATVVDFGAGTGAYAVALARLRPDLRIVALDEQPEMLALLRANVDRAKVTNVESIASEGALLLRGRADRVLAVNVLHELGDAALGELRDLLHGNGRALFVDWNADVERPLGPPREHVYGPAEARARLERAGLRVVREERFPYHYGIVAER